MAAQNIEFLEVLGSAYNFEQGHRDAYVCILLDLMMYKYPPLAKGAFALLI
jgi:hypothetical protein